MIDGLAFPIYVATNNEGESVVLKIALPGLGGEKLPIEVETGFLSIVHSSDGVPPVGSKEWGWRDDAEVFFI